MSDSVVEIGSVVNVSDVNASDVNTSLVNTSDVNTSDVNVIDVNTNAVQIVTPTKPSNQDCMQKISIIPTVAFELYRVLIS